MKNDALIFLLFLGVSLFGVFLVLTPGQKFIDGSSRTGRRNSGLPRHQTPSKRLKPVTNLFGLKEHVPEGLWFRRADGVMLKTTGRTAPLFYDSSWCVRVFKHEVVAVDDEQAKRSCGKIYFTNLDAHMELQESNLLDRTDRHEH